MSEGTAYDTVGDAGTAARRGVPLRYRLVLLVLVSVLPLLGLNLWRQYFQYRTGIEASGERTLTLARSMALLVDAELQVPIATLQALAASPALQRDDLAAFRKEAEAAVARQFPGTNIVLLREDGQQFVNTILARDAPLPARPYLDSVHQVFANNQPAISNLYQGAVGARQVIAIDVPVRNSDGSVRYALSMVLPTDPRLAMFEEVIRRQRLPDTWVVSIFDRDGVNVARVPNGDRFVGQRASSLLIGPLRSAATGVLQTTSLEGLGLLTAFSHAPKSGWAVAIGVRREELARPFVEATMAELASGGGLLLLCLVAAVWVARGIAAPIWSLSGVVAAAERSDNPVPAPTGLPEVDAVAAALRAMEDERRRSREAEAVLRDSIETMAEGFVLYDDHDRLVMCNQSYRNFYPETAADLVPGLGFEEILRLGTARGRFPDAVGREEEWIAERVRSQRDRTGTMEQRLADGRWVLVTKHRLANGWVAGLRVDITALKTAQEAEMVLRDGIETIPQGFSIYDAEDRLVMCNEMYRTLFPGNPDHLVVGARYEDILRGGIARGYYEVPRGEEEEWIAARLRDHRAANGMTEQRLSDGRWALSTKRRLSNGWTAGLRIDITGLKVAQSALAASEQRFRDIAEVSGDWIWETDREHRFRAIYGSKEGQPIGPETLLGRTRWEGAGADPASSDIWVRHKADLDAHRPFRDFRYEINCPGASLFISTSGKPVFDQCGEFTGYHGTATDETAMVEVQRRAEAAEIMIRRVFQTTQDLIVVTDSQGNLLQVSPSVRFLLGFEPEELIGRNGIDIVHADDLERTREHMRSARRTESAQDFECRFVDKQGRCVTFWWNVVWSEPEHRYFFTGRDITERQQMEQRVRDSEDQLKRAQRLARMGSDLRDLRTGEREWSDETYRIFGVDRDSFEATLENVFRMVHPQDQPRLVANRSKTIVGACPPPIEYRIVRPDGEIRNIYREWELICDEAGQPTQLLGTVHDVTEQRRTEAQLRQAQKMEAIGNLTGGLAHDFNNLLGVVIGNLELARPSLRDDQELDEMVGDAIEAAWRGANLTRRLLAFARRQSLQPARLDINELVGNTVRLLRRLLGEDIEVVLDLSDEIWPAMVDPAQLEASLANLANNARDAMPRGGRLTIKTSNAELDADYAAVHPDVAVGDYVVIEIGDTGVGMSPETASHIFEPFFTTKEPGRGTGLGLSMVFGFLRQSGGHVNVYSEEGVGTIFRLYLPRSLDEAGGVEAREIQAAAGSAGECVLVVEDNISMRRIVVRQLREFGYRVVETDRAAGALELLQHEPVDLLFTDIVMPGGLDGVELAHLALERWPNLKIVLTSGFPEIRTSNSKEALEGLRLLSKPYSREEFARALRDALDGQARG